MMQARLINRTVAVGAKDIAAELVVLALLLQE